MGYLEQVVSHDEEGRFRVPEGGKLLSTVVILLFTALVSGLLLTASWQAYVDGRLTDAALGAGTSVLLAAGVLIAVGRRVRRWSQDG